MNTFEEIKERAKLLHYKWGVYSKVCNRSLRLQRSSTSMDLTSLLNPTV